MYYLEKVIAIMENSAYRTSMEKLDEILQAQGIVLQCFWIAELGLSEMTAEAIFDGVWTEYMSANSAGQQDVPARKDGVGQQVLSARENAAACLWFTDMADIVKVLRCLDMPVLALLHEVNRSQDLSAAWYACEEPGELDAAYLDKVYRRYRRIPWEILKTERCVIRETTPEDVETFYEIYKEPSITRYTDGLYPETEREKQYIYDYIDKVYGFYGFGIWTVIKRDSGEVIGRAGLSCREGFEEPEIGFIIGVPWQRQGYAEEICRAILDYGREELEFTQVQAFVRPENTASLGLCRKLGMEKVGEVWLSGEKHVCLRVDFE